jgi:hypothetical protein
VSTLLDLVELIRDTQAELARAQQTAAQHGPSLGLDLSTASLRHRLEELEQQFADATAIEEIDVCSYRLIPGESGRYPIAAIGRVFTHFQTLLTVLYDSIKRDEPRRRAKVTPESTWETTLDFGYAYAGSLGFVFTAPNDRMLIGESLLDMAMNTLMELPRVESTDALSVFGKKYGSAPIRLAFQWAQAHVEAGLSVDVEWRRTNEIRLHVLMQVPQLQRFVNLVASTGETERETLTVYGELVGIDVVTRAFHIVVDSKLDIRGLLDGAFRAPDPLVIRSYYTAKIIVETQLKYATGEETTKYYLISLNSSAKAISGRADEVDLE